MSDSNVIRKHLDAAVKEIDGRTIRGIASQQIVDRDDDVIIVAGIDLSRFNVNPVLLADHDRTFNLGSVTRVWVDARHSGGPALLFEAELDDPVSERQREAVAAIRAGSRRGISIGFKPLEADRQPVLDGQRGYTFRRCELLEISSVNLPSCPTCVLEQKAWLARNGEEVVLEIAKVGARACACQRGGHRGEPDEIAIAEIAPDLEAWVHAFERRKRARRSEPFEPIVDVDPAVVREEVARAIRAGLAQAVRQETQAAIDRARGRVD